VRLHVLRRGLLGLLRRARLVGFRYAGAWSFYDSAVRGWLFGRRLLQVHSCHEIQIVILKRHIVSKRSGSHLRSCRLHQTLASIGIGVCSASTQLSRSSGRYASRCSARRHRVCALAHLEWLLVEEKIGHLSVRRHVDFIIQAHLNSTV
jgi:hypothetical protein